MGRLDAPQLAHRADWMPKLSSSDWLDADADAAPEDESLARRFETIGFRAGIDVGEEGVLQSGFNNGYHAGIALGEEIGKLQGAVRMLLEMSVAVGLRDGSPEAVRLRHLYEKLDAQAKRHLVPAAGVEKNGTRMCADDCFNTASCSDCACGEKPDGIGHEHCHEHTHHTYEHTHENSHEGPSCCGETYPARLMELRGKLGALMAVLGLAQDNLACDRNEVKATRQR